MPELTLNRPMVDWVTLTTFTPGVHRAWDDHAKMKFRAKIQKRLQYKGYGYDVGQGNLFIGLGQQRKQLHAMMQVSGEAAHWLGRLYGVYLKPPAVARCTRIDLQITTIMPPKWNQKKLFDRLHKNNPETVVEYRESGATAADKLSTIYFGSRQSARFTRIYMKPADEMLLRFETQYGNDRAHHMATKILPGKVHPAGYLLHELNRTIGDHELIRLFAPLLGSVPMLSETIRVDSDLQRTEHWLMTAVLPSFERAINAHEASGEVFDAFRAAITNKLRSDANSAADRES